MIGDTPTLAADPLHLSVGGAEHHVAASGTLCRSAGAAYELLASFVAAGSLSTSALHLARTRRYAVLFKDDARSSPGAFCWIRLDLRFHVDRAKHPAFPVTFARKYSCTRSPCFEPPPPSSHGWSALPGYLASSWFASRLASALRGRCPYPTSATDQIRYRALYESLDSRPRALSCDADRGVHCPTCVEAARRGAEPRGLTHAIRPRVGSRLTTRPSFGPSTSLFSPSSRSRDDGLASEASSPRRCRP